MRGGWKWGGLGAVWEFSSLGVSSGLCKPDPDQLASKEFRCPWKGPPIRIDYQELILGQAGVLLGLGGKSVGFL